MKKVLKVLLSPSCNILIGVIILNLLFMNYKFFIIYFLMGPPAALLIWAAHSNVNKLDRSDIKLVWYILASIVGFILTSLIWINSLISYTRIVFFSENENVNV